jgi:hypothetical protein
MAEAFVRTIKRDYVRVSTRPNAESVMRQLPSWIAHYNEVHPHKALGYRSPREFIVSSRKTLTVSGRSGATTGSPTVGKHVSKDLSAKSGYQLYVPIGFAHGFVSLEDDTVAVYKVSNYYAPA